MSRDRASGPGFSATAREISAAHLTARGRMTSTAQLENRMLRDEGGVRSHEKVNGQARDRTKGNLPSLRKPS
jgi:hypothetical protein